MRYLAAIAALGLLVAFHELGHLFFARLFKIRVDKFAVGFGPSILSWRGKQIEWVIGAIPLGGYVKIHGMNPHDDGVDSEDSFARAKAWKRALVLFGGAFFNYLLAVVVMVGLLIAGTHVAVPNAIGTVQPGSEAARAQLKPGDEIVAIDGVPLAGWRELVEKVNDSPNQPLTFTIQREEQRLELPVRPRMEKGVGRIGVSQQYVFRRHEVGDAVVKAFSHVHRTAADGIYLLGRLIQGKGGVQLASPVIIVKQASEAASSGLDAFLRIVVGISVALAVFNLLPVPALDGGRLVFVAVEAATGRPVNVKLETFLHTVGFVALIGLLLIVAMRDVVGLLGPKTGPPELADAGSVEPDGGSAEVPGTGAAPGLDAGVGDLSDGGAAADAGR